MRRHVCPTCGATLAFDALTCPGCACALGYLPLRRELCPIRSIDDAGTFVVSDDTTELWQCLNRSWGCNWMLPRGVDGVWCTSCRLTRGRPDTANPTAVDAWARAEAVKRQLVDQLIALDLPVDATANPHGLVFDLLFLTSGVGVTGHREGVITVDLRELDDVYRDDVRRQLGESYRTVIGHLRHEFGHYSWPLLVTPGRALEDCRALFGDERVDYAAAIGAHYERGAEASGTGAVGPSPDRYVSGYAASHPSEDWAETVAHYLHLRDGLETAGEHGLADLPGPDAGIDELVEAWNALTEAVGAVNAGLGQPVPYPFTIGGRVAEKIAFVHECWTQTSQRERQPDG